MKQTPQFETTIGAALLLAVGLVCTVIIILGESPDLFQPAYRVVARFPDASGVEKGDGVYLSGAQIGKVTSDPAIVPETQQAEVTLSIEGDVKIRRDAQFVIANSGMMGDRFVDVRPHEYKPGETKAEYFESGDMVQGTGSPGIQEMMTSAKPLLVRANHIAGEVDDMVTRLNNDVLSGPSTDDLKHTFGKLRDVADHGGTLATNVQNLTTQMKTGDGALGRVLGDKKVSDNLAEFMANLTKHGPIFYQDDASAPAPPPPAPASWRSRK